jgi:predicted Fe-Mo cluster-binding NifX family protein
MRKSTFAVLWALLLAVGPVLRIKRWRRRSRLRRTAGDTPAAAVGSQAGRSPFFLLFDKQGAFLEAVKNPYKDSANAGISALDLLASRGVKVLVAESFGPRIVEVMREKGIRPVEFKGSAKDAVQNILKLQ